MASDGIRIFATKHSRRRPSCGPPTSSNPRRPNESASADSDARETNRHWRPEAGRSFLVIFVVPHPTGRAVRGVGSDWDQTTVQEKRTYLVTPSPIISNSFMLSDVPSVDEAGKALGMSTATTYRHWNYARTWLHGELLGTARAVSRARFFFFFFGGA